MAVIRNVRFKADVDDVNSMLDKRARLLAAVRTAFPGLTGARLVRMDDETWLDSWRWSSLDAMQAALAGGPGLPEAAAAFALVRDATEERGELVDEEAWA